MGPPLEMRRASAALQMASVRASAAAAAAASCPPDQCLSSAPPSEPTRAVQQEAAGVCGAPRSTVGRAHRSAPPTPSGAQRFEPCELGLEQCLVELVGVLGQLSGRLDLFRLAGSVRVGVLGAALSRPSDSFSAAAGGTSKTRSILVTLLSLASMAMLPTSASPGMTHEQCPSARTRRGCDGRRGEPRVGDGFDSLPVTT